MTTIDKLERTNNKLKGNFYYNNLMTGLGYKPEDWIWTGDIIDLGGVYSSCICGHKIRYQFPLRNKKTGSITIVGCVCVENYKLFTKEIIEQIKNKIKEIEKETRKKKSEAKKLIQKEEIKKLIEERKPYLDKINYLDSLYHKTAIWKPYDLYTYKSIDPEKYVRFKSCITALKKDILKLKTLYNKYLETIKEMDLKWKNIQKERKEAERIMKIEEEKEKQRIANLKHIGTVGERVELKVKLIESTLNRNYDIWFYKFEDMDGNIITKWGILTSVDFKYDTIYTFTAIVKKHSEWNEIKSTTVNRLKDIKEVKC